MPHTLSELLSFHSLPFFHTPIHCFRLLSTRILLSIVLAFNLLYCTSSKRSFECRNFFSFFYTLWRSRMRRCQASGRVVMLEFFWEGYSSDFDSIKCSILDHEIHYFRHLLVKIKINSFCNSLKFVLFQQVLVHLFTSINLYQQTKFPTQQQFKQEKFILVNFDS